MLHKLLCLCVLLVFLSVGSFAFAQEEEFVFGVILVGPYNDRGWSQSHYEGGLYVEQNLPGSRMVWIENVYPGNPETTFAAAVEEMVAEGARIIFTTSDAFEEDTDNIALQYPNIVFVNTTGDTVIEGTAPSNVGNYNSQFEMGRALSACAAGLLTQTGEIGYLGALINQETRRHVAAAYLAAKHCYATYAGGNPEDLGFTVTWIGFWFNIPGTTLDPTEVSAQFFDSGADVVISGIDTTEALVVAGQRRSEGEEVWGIPTDNPRGCEEAPAACPGVPYLNWGPPYLRNIMAVKEGTWQQTWEWEPPRFGNLEEFNDPDLSPMGFVPGEALSEEHLAQIELFLAEMTAFAEQNPGNPQPMFLWEGPLNLQDGTPLADAGELVDPMDIWFLPQLLEGIDGPST